MSHPTDPHGHGAEAAPASHQRPSGSERQIDRDISLRGVALTVLGVFLGTALSMLAMWWLFSWLLASAEKRPAPPALVQQAAGQLPPGPRLQASPDADMTHMRARENELLSSYGWADRAAGTVRIPVSRAMDVLAATGFPGPIGPASASAARPPTEAAGAAGGATAGAGGEPGTAVPAPAGAGVEAPGAAISGSGGAAPPAPAEGRR